MPKSQRHSGPLPLGRQPGLRPELSPGRWRRIHGEGLRSPDPVKARGETAAEWVGALLSKPNKKIEHLCVDHVNSVARTQHLKDDTAQSHVGKTEPRFGRVASRTPPQSLCHIDSAACSTCHTTTSIVTPLRQKAQVATVARFLFCLMDFR